MTRQATLFQTNKEVMVFSIIHIIRFVLPNLNRTFCNNLNKFRLQNFTLVFILKSSIRFTFSENLTIYIMFYSFCFVQLISNKCIQKVLCFVGYFNNITQITLYYFVHLLSFTLVKTPRISVCCQMYLNFLLLYNFILVNKSWFTTNLWFLRGLVLVL